MDVDASLKILGEFGRVQNTNLLVFALGLAVSTLQANSIAFTIDQSLEHLCKAPDGFTAEQITPLDNQTGDREASDGCHMYEVVNGTLTGNITTCQYGWEYGNKYEESTVLTDFDLVCSRSIWAGMLMSMHFAGFLVGCSLVGQAADIFGRRIVCMVSLLLIGLLGSVLSFVWDLYLMLVLRFFLGLVMPASNLPGFVRVIEMFTPRRRILGNLIIQNFWSLGMITLAPIAYLLPNWRDFQLAISLACLPMLPLHWFFSYESVRWLVQKGRLEESEKTLQRIAKSKRIKREGTFLLPEAKSPIGGETEPEGGNTKESREGQPAGAEESKAQQVTLKKPSKNYTFLDLFRTRTLIKHFLIIFVCWFVMNTTYFGLVIYSTSLAGNKYLNFFLLSLVEAPGVFITFLIMKKFGRRKPLIFFFFFGAIACFLVAFLPVKTVAGADLTTLIVAVAMIGKFCAFGTYNITMLFGAEVFPTVLRNIATGSAAAIGKTSTILCPFIVVLKDVRDFIPLTIFGVLSLFASVCVSLLPETDNKPLPEAYEDAEKVTSHGHQTQV